MITVTKGDFVTGPIRSDFPQYNRFGASVALARTSHFDETFIRNSRGPDERFKTHDPAGVAFEMVLKQRPVRKKDPRAEAALCGLSGSHLKRRHRDIEILASRANGSVK
jgi:hypothetical protein